MTIGFRFNEVMTGYHKFDRVYSMTGDNISTDKQFMEFEIIWGPDDILKWLNPFGEEFMKQPLRGHITIEGLCEKCPCEGTLTLAYHRGEICYDINFFHNHRVYRYIGKKTNIRPWNLPFSHTICRGRTILKTYFRDWEVSESVVYFKLSTLWKFLKSFRVIYG